MPITMDCLRLQGIAFTAMVYVSGYIFLIFVAICLGQHTMFVYPFSEPLA